MTMIVTVMMMIGLVRGQFVDCQVAPPAVNKTGATALPHLGRITITVDSLSFRIDPAHDNSNIKESKMHCICSTVDIFNGCSSGPNGHQVVI